MKEENNKPIDTNVIINTMLVFYEEEQKENTFGSNDKVIEISYSTKLGIMQITEIESFGDRKFIGTYGSDKNEKITLEEMLENIKEMANMTYKEFIDTIYQID